MKGDARARRWERVAPWAFVAVVAGALAALLVALGGLSEGPRKDERFFWPVSARFAERWPPGVAGLRDYEAPGTPLPFLLYGAVERATGRGLILGRVLNAVLALGVVALIAGRGGPGWRGRVLCACGLMACPYFVGQSVYLYTDAPAVALVALGMAAYAGGRHVLAGACMALAVACRQYMVAFPAAIFAWEVWEWWRRGRGPGAEGAGIVAWAAPLGAAATLGGWFWFFGGPGPRSGIERFGVVTAEASVVLVRNGLFALTCVGAYYVVVEWALFRRRETAREVWTVRTAAWAVALGGLFLVFPPLRNTGGETEAMGYMDKGARAVMGDAARMVVYWALAVLAAARFGRWGLCGLLVACHAIVMTKAHIGWEKYAVPLLAALWVFRSRGIGVVRV